MNYTENDNLKTREKSIKISASKYNSNLQNSYDKENQIFTSQLQELVRHFSSIENYQIRQYAINLVREVAKCESEEKVKTYMDEMMREIL